MLLEKKNYREGSVIHFIDFKEDSLIFSKKILKVPVFVQDFFIKEKEFIMLNTMPRTLGENLKSTDFLTKYDENFKIILKKDMNISKYPDGNCFIVGNNEKLFYINEGFNVNSYKDNRKLIISEIDDSFNIINQKSITKNISNFKYEPVLSIFIEKIGIVVISNHSKINGDNPMYRIDMFDLELNLKWSEDLTVDNVSSLGYSKLENKIYLITKKSKSQLLLFDYLGKKSLFHFGIEHDVISVVANDNNIFSFGKGLESHQLVKIDFSGKVISKKDIPVSLIPNAMNTKLYYQNNVFFLVSIDNNKNRLFVDKIHVN